MDPIAERIAEEAKFILDTGATVRGCASRYGVGKTTVHKDMRERLPRLDAALARRVGRVLDRNRQERHLRGGEATRRRFEQRRSAQADGTPGTT